MRDLLTKTRLRPDQTSSEELMLKTYSTTMRMAGEEILQRWVSGISSPQPAPFTETTKVVNKDGVHVGFNVWLLWGEPQTLGRPDLRIEIE